MKTAAGARHLACLSAMFLMAMPATQAQTVGRPTALEPPVIHVEASSYGGPLLGEFCDTTDVVAKRCEGRMRCTIAVDDRLCPIAELPKQVLIRALTVRFHCGTTVTYAIRRVEEPGTLRLACTNRG